ncbi:hypothetical protein OPT61_g8936 [Boeremia exigua]|uniref:Uncharacterized protein n=1 Tax=Boeremia exigua TaxID=749465 RepID=A0ACC2HX83_9PLEO|nr:hypothetical protein OPT61_g8936 [Boeremia exigua]
MLWRWKSRSPSPPNQASSIPEMEHHSATPDSAAPGPPIDDIDSVSALSSVSQPNSDHNQESGETEAACPNSKPVASSAQVPSITDKDDAEPSTALVIEDVDAPKAKKSSSIRSKAQRSRPRFLTLLACVSYLLFHLLGLDLGMRLINGYTEPRLHQAEFQLQAALNGLVSERVVHKKLDVLLDTQMERQYSESYEHCLARGLYQAGSTFLGINFTRFPDARDQTVDWVTNNCDRLFYTPQLHTSNPSQLWKMVHSVRSSAEKAFALFRHRAALLRCKIRGIETQSREEHAVLQPAHNTTARPEILMKMLFGFDLDCEERARCRLVYSGPSLSTADMKTMSDTAGKAGREMSKLSYPFKRLFHINGRIISLLSLLQPLLAVYYLLTVRLSSPHPMQQATSVSKISRTARAWSRLCHAITHLDNDEKLALGLVINTALYALLHYEFNFITSEFDRLLLPAGLGLCAFHTPQALMFLNPVPGTNETVHSFCQAIWELYIVFRDVRCLPTPAPKKERPSPRQAPTICCSLKAASKIGARFVSPLTPISEDLYQERKAMYEEQGRWPRDDDELQYGYATESESGYDSDVDLSSGATPVVSDDEDWSVVER